MADLEEHMHPQHEVDECLTSCLHGALSHLVEQRDDLSSRLENIGYGDVNQAISPDEHIDPPAYSPPHVDNYCDRLNQRVLKDFSVYAKNTQNNPFDDLEDILSDEDKSLPIVSLHPDYFKWQELHNDGKAHYRHAIVVKELKDDSVVFHAPMQGMYPDAPFKTEMPKTTFKELWADIVDGKIRDPIPKDLTWLEVRDTQPGQTRL
ncbi:MAG: hypothetical protein ABEJ98_05245 [Candidatus Nanohaloarchaea archaeon]